MSAPREVPRPLVVLRGRPAAECLSTCAGAATLLGALAIAPAVVHAAAPWGGAGAWLAAGGWVVYALAAVALVFAVQRWAAARQGQAEVFAERVVVRKDDRRAETLRFVDLAGFDDARGDVVRLLPRDPRWPTRFEAVPTPDERARATLIEALVAAGVRRVGPDAPVAEAREVQAVAARLKVGPDPRARRTELLGCLAFVVAPAGLLSLTLVPVVPAWGVVVGCVVFWVVAMVAAVRAAPGGRQVSFFDDRIVLGEWEASDGLPRRSLSWDDVVGWRATGPDHLRLALRDGLLAGSHGDPFVPTPTPEDRRRLEALLAEKGVPRIA